MSQTQAQREYGQRRTLAARFHRAGMTAAGIQISNRQIKIPQINNTTIKEQDK